jgi:hypothetical protein
LAAARALISLVSIEHVYHSRAPRCKIASPKLCHTLPDEFTPRVRRHCYCTP